MELLTVLLTPILLPMRALFNLYSNIIGIPGAAIILLSFSVALLLLPLQRWGRKKEQQINHKAAQVRADVAALDKTLRGEVRFNAIEQIYQRHDFHPAQNMLAGMGFIVQLPFLLAGVLLFTDAATVGGNDFLFLTDLAKPDALLGGINLLPFLVLALSVWDATRHYASDRAARNKYIVIAVLLCALIYPLPAALVLYWLFINLSNNMLFNALPPRYKAVTKQN